VYSLLSILGTHNREDMSRTLLAMSTSSDSCLAMRQSGSFFVILPCTVLLCKHLCMSKPSHVEVLHDCTTAQ